MGNVIEIDTSVTAYGKNVMRRDWNIREYKTKRIIARATRYLNLHNKFEATLSSTTFFMICAASGL